MDKNERLTCTPYTKQDYEMVQLLSDLSGNAFSFIVEQALHEWLKDNFVDQIKRHQQVEHLLNETGIPFHFHDFGGDKWLSTEQVLRKDKVIGQYKVFSMNFLLKVSYQDVKSIYERTISRCGKRETNRI